MAKDDIFIRLTEEDAKPGICGRLLEVHVRNTRCCNEFWEDSYIDFARDIGFSRGVASPCVFKHKTRRLSLTVRGDDFTLLGSDEVLNLFEKEIKAKLQG